MTKNFYKRNLPHIIPDNAQFFVTFVLDGVLPIDIIKRFQTERDERINNAKKNNENINDIQKIYFGKYDSLLDNSKSNINYLQNKDLAKIVVDKIMQLDNTMYQLICFCIMPNHVHLLINTFGYSSKKNNSATTKDYYLSEIMQTIKGSTSRKCNLFQNKTGKFWQSENYDHYVRNDDELKRIINYIIQNPVKAKLCNNINDWQFTYLKQEYNEQQLGLQ